VHKQSEVRPGGKEHESGLLASTLKVSSNDQATSEIVHQYDDDDSILHLFDRVERLNNRLTRTSPRVEFPMDYSDSRLNSEEIERVISPLKARFQSGRSDMSGEFIRSIDEKRLAEYSQQFLRHLRREFPKFITRKRVYFEPESEINSQMPNSIQSRTYNKMSVAAMSVLTFVHTRSPYADPRSKIQRFRVPEPRVFNPTIVDVVSDNGQKFIVSTDGPKRVGIFHPRKFHP
jgi:oligoendopeptidase F